MNFTFDKLEKKLKNINWSKKEFANFLGINKATISKWKANNKVPKYAIIAIDYVEDVISTNKKINKLKKGFF
jgi:transcriptional regulator with XRE-family HTH domain